MVNVGSTHHIKLDLPTLVAISTAVFGDEQKRRADGART
jgi:hypothetical protein